MNVTFFEKRVLEDVVQLKILRRDHPGLSRWALNPMAGVLMRGILKRTDTQRKK